MREILFRGKRVDNGEWISGDLITTPFIRNETQQNIIYILDITKADYDCFEDLTEDNGIFEVDPETVCQYTGLTDKNGRKIFEGDIIKQESKFSGEQPFYHVVEYTEEYKMFTTDLQLCGGIDCPLNIYLSLDLCEVIGNIFDNPELIGGQP